MGLRNIARRQRRLDDLRFPPELRLDDRQEIAEILRAVVADIVDPSERTFDKTFSYRPSPANRPAPAAVTRARY
jgi:hypothetical protein